MPLVSKWDRPWFTSCDLKAGEDHIACCAAMARIVLLIVRTSEVSVKLMERNNVCPIMNDIGTVRPAVALAS